MIDGDDGHHETREPRGTDAGIGGREVSLFDLAGAVIRHWYWLVGMPLLTVIILVSVTMILPRTYTVDTAFMPQAPQTSSSRLAGVAAQFGVAIPSQEPGQSPAFYANLLMSRPILRAVATTEYDLQVGGRRRHGDLVDLYERGGDGRAEQVEETIRDLEERLSIAINRETGVVTTSVTDRSAPLAKLIADRLLELLNEFNLNQRQTQAAIERRFVEERVREAREELMDTERFLGDFLRQNRAFENSPELVFEHDRLVREVGLRQQVYTSLVQSLEEAKIDEIRNTPVITVVEPPVIPPLPDSRNLLLKMILGVLLGGVVGVLTAFVHRAIERAEETEPEAVERFRGQLRRTFGNVSRPWRVLRRRSRDGAL